jgi:aldose 1-epimerase
VLARGRAQRVEEFPRDAFGGDKSVYDVRPMANVTITHREFGKTADGKIVEAYHLSGSPSGASFEVMTFGATITKILVLGRDGTLADVNLGFDTVAQYEAEGPYLGAIIGRYGNRIAHGMFSLNGVTHRLAKNNAPNHLHGGKLGYDKRLWSAELVDGGVRFSLVDPDGTEGYPGTVRVSVTYTLTEHSGLRIAYEATTDKPTPINLTNHAYFNLAGIDTRAHPIYGHIAQIAADSYTPVGATLIPTGQVASVEGTALDFRTPKRIGDGIDTFGAIGGYDHNLVLGRKGTFRKVAEVHEPTSGRVVETWTTEPAIQFYSGNFLDAALFKGKNGVPYARHTGFCLETQHYPDSPNNPVFPSTILHPGEKYETVTEYRFGVR